MPVPKPYVLCVDVGAPRNIGWASSGGGHGNGVDLGEALEQLSYRLRAGEPAALGFEAPIWTPVRADLIRITGRRGGLEITHNRPWSAGAGCGALAAALALMPWCLARVAKVAGPVATTVDLGRFQHTGGLLLWEAFVSGKKMKAPNALHADDARLACDAFLARWPDIVSDIPAERTINHAVSCAIATGLAIDINELTLSAIVVGITTAPAHPSAV